jgi:hypothetical protein
MGAEMPGILFLAVFQSRFSENCLLQNTKNYFLKYHEVHIEPLRK